MINAGMLNKRITIQHLVDGSPSQSSFGEPEATWTDFKEMWASIEPIQGNEFWSQQQVQSEVTIRIRTRYVGGIEPAMRVSYGDRIFVIESVIDPKERHEELQLMCSEGVSDV
jgi:SPP1 family predicted phage head-tail adaptor